MRVVILKETQTPDHGMVLQRAAGVDIADTTPATSIPDVAMRTFVNNSGGSIAEGTYVVATSASLFKRTSADTRRSSITSTSNMT